jgi:hypothetical protein
MSCSHTESLLSSMVTSPSDSIPLLPLFTSTSPCDYTVPTPMIQADPPIFLVVLDFELRASCLLGRYFTTKIGSHKLIAQGDFEP